MGKGENAGYQHFLTFQQCFLKGFSVGDVKSQDGVVKINPLTNKIGLVQIESSCRLQNKHD